MRAIVRKQLGTGAWRVVGVSQLSSEPVAYALFETWAEAMAWATGAEPRPRRRNMRLLDVLTGGRR